jgi:undecaprenyl diphosphate synthase
MNSLESQINKDNLPTHVAIIMDGNGRWAQNKSQPRAFGHIAGVKSVKTIVETAAEIGIKNLTLYAFSTENWSRPKAEIDALMELLVDTINKETPTLNKNGISLKAIGNLKSLPVRCQEKLQEAIDNTAHNTRLTLILALSYSSRWEITNAVQKIARKVEAGTLKADEVNEKTVSANMCTANIPDPELLIRTSGEYRISNYLLWQIAYSELYFTETLWPDFGEEELYKALINYQSRERRFGKTSEQIENK